jgi:hypothetical protein
MPSRPGLNFISLARGDVGDGEALACHVRLVLQHVVKPLGHLAHLLGLRVAEIGKLRLLQGRQTRVGMPDAVGNSGQKIVFYAPVSHFNKRALFSVHTRQVGLGEQAFQVGADGTGFGQHAAIVQLQCGHFGQRTLGAKDFAFVLPRVEVYIDQIDTVNAFLDHEHHHAPGAGRAGGNKKLHTVAPFNSCTFG